MTKQRPQGIAQRAFHLAVQTFCGDLAGGTLTHREHEVLRLLVQGLNNHQIAAAMFLSVETVKTHMKHIMEKLNVCDRTQAAIKAVQSGLVSSPDENLSPAATAS